MPELQLETVRSARSIARLRLVGLPFERLPAHCHPFPQLGSSVFPQLDKGRGMAKNQILSFDAKRKDHGYGLATTRDEEGLSSFCSLYDVRSMNLEIAYSHRCHGFHCSPPCDYM